MSTITVTLADLGRVVIKHDPPISVNMFDKTYEVSESHFGELASLFRYAGVEQVVGAEYRITVERVSA